MILTPCHDTLRLGLALGLACVGAVGTEGQEARAAAGVFSPPDYLSAAALHYRVAQSEARVLASWELEADEVPVVLHLASRGGISPDVVVASRSDGRPWARVARDVASRGGNLRVTLDGPVPGELRRAHDLFLRGPGEDWATLTDPEVVALVNVAFLARVLEESCVTILEARSRSGSFARAYAVLAGGGP